MDWVGANPPKLRTAASRRVRTFAMYRLVLPVAPSMLPHMDFTTPFEMGDAEPPDDTGKPLKRFVIHFVAGSNRVMRTTDTAVEALAAFDEMITDWVFSTDSITDHETGESLTGAAWELRAGEEQSAS